jgi:hypothetical protein
MFTFLAETFAAVMAVPDELVTDPVTVPDETCAGIDCDRKINPAIDQSRTVPAIRIFMHATSFLRDIRSSELLGLRDAAGFG